MKDDTSATTADQLMAETLDYARVLAALAAGLEPDDPEYAHAANAARRMVHVFAPMGVGVTPGPGPHSTRTMRAPSRPACIPGCSNGTWSIWPRP